MIAAPSPRVFEIPDLERPDATAEAAVGAAADAVAAALRESDLVVFPTETVYGIAGLASDPRATSRIFAAKRRPGGLALPVMAATRAAALRLGTAGAVARALADSFWPGPLTLVVPRSAASRDWELGDRPDTVALRVPDHPVALAILSRTPPLAVTSANRSGEPPAATIDELRRIFPGATVAVFVVQAELPSAEDRPPSTIVDLTGSEPRIARQGSIAEDAIRDVLRRPPSPGRG